jgi:hypothetical protein
MKKIHFVLVVLLLLFIISVFIIGWLILALIDRNNSTIGNVTAPTPTINAVSPTINEQLSLTAYKYTGQNIVPNFSVGYPKDWDTTIDNESGGSFDLVSKSGKSEIDIDYTGLNGTSFVDALQSWLTGGGYYQTGNYSHQETISGLVNNLEFHTYQINNLTNGQSSTFTIVAVGQLVNENSPIPAFLAIKIIGPNASDYTNQILQSISVAK